MSPICYIIVYMYVNLHGEFGLKPTNAYFCKMGKVNSVLIPNVTRDDRIGSAFNQLFIVIHQTETRNDNIEWNFKNTLFLHPFFLVPLAIYRDSHKCNISCRGMCYNIKEYFKAICFSEVYDVTDLSSQETLDSYIGKSYIPISRFSIRGDVDKIQEILQKVIEAQSRVASNMRTPISHLLSELVGNIGEHSASKYGYLFCQRVKKELYIIIADSGKTVYGSYRDTQKYMDVIGTSDAMALKIANNGYSTKDRPEAENRGYGISKSREMIVDGLGGAFFMLSGTAFYRHDANGVNSVDIPGEYRWNGTIVLVKIPLVAPNGFQFYDYVE